MFMNCKFGKNRGARTGSVQSRHLNGGSLEGLTNVFLGNDTILQVEPAVVVFNHPLIDVHSHLSAQRFG